MIGHGQNTDKLGSERICMTFMNYQISVLIRKFGGAEGNRTLDLLNAIQALSQLSYGPTIERIDAPGAELKLRKRAAKVKSKEIFDPNPSHSGLLLASHHLFGVPARLLGDLDAAQHARQLGDAVAFGEILNARKSPTLFNRFLHHEVSVGHGRDLR